MPKVGGFRAGSGRPRGSGGGGRSDKTPLYAIDRQAARVNMQPLEYMLSVMNDPDVDPLRRDRMATCAAPYCHPKAEWAGKKADADERAKTAEKGSEWEAILAPDDVESRKAGLARAN